MAKALILALVVLIAFMTGIFFFKKNAPIPFDPKTSFEKVCLQINQPGEYQDDKNLCKITFREFSYNVRKTDSLVSPYAANSDAVAVVEYVDAKDGAKKKGCFFTANAALQNEKWIFKTFEFKQIEDAETEKMRKEGEDIQETLKYVLENIVKQLKDGEISYSGVLEKEVKKLKEEAADKVKILDLTYRLTSRSDRNLVARSVLTHVAKFAPCEVSPEEYASMFNCPDVVYDEKRRIE